MTVSLSSTARLERELRDAGHPEVLRTTEAARVARMSRERLLDHIHEGRLVASRPGGIGCWRVTLSSLAAFLSGVSAEEAAS